MEGDNGYDDRRDRSQSPVRRRSASPARRDEDERMPDRDRREPRYFQNIVLFTKTPDQKLPKTQEPTSSLRE